MTEALSVVVADDHPLYRDGVVSTLRSAGLDVVGEASIAREAIRLVRDLRPDLALFDVTMPGGGIAAAAEAHACESDDPRGNADRVGGRGRPRRGDRSRARQVTSSRESRDASSWRSSAASRAASAM